MRSADLHTAQLLAWPVGLWAVTGQALSGRLAAKQALTARSTTGLVVSRAVCRVSHIGTVYVTDPTKDAAPTSFS